MLKIFWVNKDATPRNLLKSYKQLETSMHIKRRKSWQHLRTNFHFGKQKMKSYMHNNNIYNLSLILLINVERRQKIHGQYFMESRYWNLRLKNFLQVCPWILCEREKCSNIYKVWQRRKWNTIVLKKKRIKWVLDTLRNGSTWSSSQATTSTSNISWHQIKKISWFLIF